MIEALKSDDIINKVGGRFKLCALIQRRLVQLMDGARPMVDRRGRSDLEVVIDEILHDKIVAEFDASDPDTQAAMPQLAGRD
ncbi:MAG: DNA-directed RNA polymerase subunit omega [Phycisphaerales bacterium]